MIKDDLNIIQDFLTSEECQGIRDYISKNKETSLFTQKLGIAHKEGITYRALFPTTNRPSEYLDIKPLIETYAERMANSLKDFYKLEEPLYAVKVSIQRLTPGIQILIHRDHDHDSKMYTAIAYLNGDFGDGELIFLDHHTTKTSFDLYTEDMGGIVYKPIGQELVMFPSNTWHGLKKVSEGDRDCLIIWFTPYEDEQIDWQS